MKSPLSKYRYKKQYFKFIIACMMVITAHLAIKLPYTTQMVAIIDDFGTSKSQVALGLTIYYFTFAVTQLVASAFIDRFNIKNFLIASSVLTAVTYALVGVTTELWQVWVILVLNGIFQSGQVGCVQYFIGKLIPNDSVAYAQKMMSVNAMVATALAYGVSGICVAIMSWRATFVVMAVFLMVSILFFAYQVKITEKCVKKEDVVPDAPVQSVRQKEFIVPEGKNINYKFIFVSCLLMCLLANFINYGMANWMPNMLKEIHHFPNSLSIILTFLFPLAALPSGFIMINTFDKKGNIYFFGVLTAGGILLTIVATLLGYSLNFWVAILLCMLFRFVQGCFSICYSSTTMMKLKYYVNPAKSSLILNSVGAFSAGFMPFVTGSLLDNFGWNVYYISMAGIAAIALLLALFSNVYVKKNKELKKWF